MNKYGLLGYPLGHSFSRKFFLEKFDRENITASFDNFEYENVELMKQAVSDDTDLRGFAITIPHKQSIIPFLDECDDAIQAIGAVNCVKISRTPDTLFLKGYNTDVIGFEESFKEFLQVHHKRALVLGTGGASKAVLYVLSKLGIDAIKVSRTKTNECISYEDVTAEIMADVQVVVNTTPLGMYPKIDTAPCLPYENVSSQHYFYDLVYNPEETLFMTKAKQQGATIKCGMDMLELQAEANWEIWNS